MADESKTTRNLYQALWSAADILRSRMDAGEYKNYLSGLIFFRYISDKMLYYVADELQEKTDDIKEADQLYTAAYYNQERHQALIDKIKAEFAFCIKPEFTFTRIVAAIEEETFQLEDLAQALRDIETSSEVYENLFEDIDLSSRKLGNTPQKAAQTISEVIKQLAQPDLVGYEGDILGDAYEYLIGQFASDSGKKAGEFYTPQPVAELMTRIVLYGREDKKDFSVYDAAMGSGSLMLNAGKYSAEAGTVRYYGQELNTTTYNLARMNMILHGVPIENRHIHNGDTLDRDWPAEEPTHFDAVLMNPPYSAKWSADQRFLQDPRFSPYAVLAPRSRADFAFLLHGFYHLKDDGVMAIVLPHGVLFRGNAEGKIRRALLEQGSIYAVIGLPANIFYNTGIPTTIIVLKKARSKKDVLFIGASKCFDKGKNHNTMSEAHIQRILDVYIKRESQEKFSYLAESDEIVANNYNLNIPGYVDTFEEEEPIDIVALGKSITGINAKIKESEMDLLKMLDDLEMTEASADIIEATREVFRNGR